MYAKRILPVREKGNYLLCTLLLGNVAVNAGTSIFLSDLTSGLVGLVVSTVLLVVFGEIIPQAACTRYALYIGAHTTWIVYLFMIAMFPIAWPISLILDRVLGEEIGTIFSNEQLKKLFEITAKHKEGELEDMEAKILGGALEFGKKHVKSVMTKIQDAYMLDYNGKLDSETMTNIWETGRSRIPVYKDNKDTIVAILLTKDLILVNSEEKLPVSTVVALYGRGVLKVKSNTILSDMLKTFKSGRGHMSMVYETKMEGETEKQVITGLITLEDVIEEIIREDISDEGGQRGKQGNREGINLFNIKKYQAITESQISAIASFLQKSFEVFEILPDDLLINLIKNSEMKVLNVGSVLYEKDKTYTHYTLILRGKCEIRSGLDNFTITKGAWSSLGLKAITTPTFVCDFTATDLKETQVVCISQKDLIAAVKIMGQDEKNFVPDAYKWMLK